jgi:hypothetical protein
MKKVIIIIMVTVMVLTVASWLTSTAFGHTNDDVALGSTIAEGNITVEAAPLEAAPSVTFFGSAIGGVEPGDLFYVSANNSPLDFTINLYITNADQLIHYLKYLILKVTVYVEDAGGQWLPVTSLDGIALPDTYITLENSRVEFTVTGQANYKVTIESGSYNCLPVRPGSGDVSPQFYLNAEPI